MRANFIEKYIGDISLIKNVGIYKIYHIYNLNIFYIGSSAGKSNNPNIGFYSRWSAHYNELLHNKHGNNRLQNVVDKYGIHGIRFEIIECIQDRTTILDREQYWINYYKENNALYNLNPVSKSRLNAKLTIEQRSAMSRIKNILVFNKDGEFIGKFESITQIIDNFNYHEFFKSAAHKINQCLRTNNYKSYLGNVFIAEESFSNDLLQEKLSNNRCYCIKVTNLLTKEIFLYESIRKCAENMKTSINTIQKYLKGRTNRKFKDFTFELLKKKNQYFSNKENLLI